MVNRLVNVDNGDSAELMSWDFDGQSVRTCLDDDGNPWWVAKDLCEVLGIEKPRNAVSRLDSEDARTTGILTLGGKQESWVVNESGMWSLVLTSRKPEAKRFKRWVTSEVLPSIRKTGSYNVPRLSTEQLLQLALDEIQQAKQKCDVLEFENQRLLPDARFGQELKGAVGDYSMTQVAKAIHITGQKLYAFLKKQEVLFKQGGKWMTKAKYDNSGYFRTKVFPYSVDDDGNQKTKDQLMVTAKGREFIHRLWREKTDHLF